MRSNRSIGAALAAVACMAAGTLAGDPPVEFDTIFLSGDALPGLTPGVTVFSTLQVSLNNSGVSAAIVGLQGSGVNTQNRIALYRFSPNSSPELLARTGDPVPELPADVTYSTLSDMFVDDTGRVLIDARFVGPGISDQNNAALVRWTPAGEPEIMLRKGEQAPGFDAGVTLISLEESFRTPAYDRSGNLSINTAIAGDGVDTSNDQVTLSYTTQAGFGVVTREGSAVPGIPGAQTTGRAAANINSLGRTLHAVNIQGPGVNALNNRVLISNAGEHGPGVVVREGQQAPGLPGGVTISTFGAGSDRSIPFNDSGAFIFESLLRNFGLTDWALFSNVDGNLAPVAVERTQAPGLPAGVEYDEFNDRSIRLNNAGDYSFIAFLRGPGVSQNTNGLALFSRIGSGPPSPLVRRGDQAAGLPSGVVYDNVRHHRLSDSGQVAALLAYDFGDPNDTDLALYATDPTGSLGLILAHGDQIDVDNDPLVEDLRTVDFEAANQTLSLVELDLNDVGQILIPIGLADDSGGLFLINTREIPCVADYDGDTDADIFDIIAFLGDWNAMITQTDLDNDGSFTIFDIIAFLTDWNLGCP